MSPRLDAHAHFFLPGFVEKLPESCRRQSPDEITLYHALAQQHGISQVLAVGYEGEAWAAGNNDYLATLAGQHGWLRPLAFIVDPHKLTRAQLAIWQAQRFVGLSLYLFSGEQAAKLRQTSDEIWSWLEERAWLVSVNSTGELWSAWDPVLTAHPQLRLLISHLGIPPATKTAITLEEARTTLAPVLRLAAFPAVYVKFSGFYALAEPGYAFPHTLAWPFARAVSEVFGTGRILWASDFSPALEYVSFPQTVEVLNAMPWLSPTDRAAIYYDNLAALLAAIEERNPVP
jgi:L-fuconolactonase